MSPRTTKLLPLTTNSVLTSLSQTRFFVLITSSEASLPPTGIFSRATSTATVPALPSAKLSLPPTGKLWQPTNQRRAISNRKKRSFFALRTFVGRRNDRNRLANDFRSALLSVLASLSQRAENAV